MVEIMGVRGQDKIKFFVTSFKPCSMGINIGTTGRYVALVSFNQLLSLYEIWCRNRDEFELEDYKVFGTTEDLAMINAHGDMLDAYDNRDIAKLKKLVFGEYISDNVELYLNTAIIGVRADGIKVKVVKTTHAIKYCVIPDGIIQNSNKYDKIQTKLRLSGINQDLVSYDCGLVLNISNGDYIKYMPLWDCFSLKMGTGSINNAMMGNIFISAVQIIDSRNVRIGSLIDSEVYCIQNCEILIENMVCSKINKLYDSKIRVKNASYIKLGDIGNCEIEIDNLMNLSFGYDISDSVIRFNCDFLNSILDIRKTRMIVNTTFILTKRIDIEKLERFIRKVRVIANQKSFKIMVNSNIYAECVSKLDKESIIYIVDRGKYT